MKLLSALAILVLSGAVQASVITAKSYVVLDDQGKVVLEKNSTERRSIASISKLFSLAFIKPTDQQIEITQEEVDTLKGTRMRLRGSFPENELLGVALSASNNEAAKSISRANGLAFEASKFRFPDVHLVEPSGLNPENQSTALAIAQGAREISKLPIAQETLKSDISLGKYHFHNTNPLLHKKGWEFKLSKTGYIREAGGCLVAVISIANKDYTVAILGSNDVHERWRDLSRLRRLISDEPFEDFSSRAARPVKKHRRR